MTDVSSVLHCNMQELFEIAIREDWTLEGIQTWALFKIAQCLERIAYEEGGEIGKYRSR